MARSARWGGAAPESTAQLCEIASILHSWPWAELAIPGLLEHGAHSFALGAPANSALGIPLRLSHLAEVLQDL
jgi:hypothetical protein